jgi:hypothetical protein
MEVEMDSMRMFGGDSLLPIQSIARPRRRVC